MTIPVVNWAGYQKLRSHDVADSVTVSPATFSIATGATQQLAATVKNASNETLGDAPVTWSSDDEAVATVDAEGLVTGVAAGTATITARSGDAIGTAEATVT